MIIWHQIIVICESVWKKIKQIECKKEQILNAKKGLDFDTKWHNNMTGEMGWGIWPQRETDHDIFDAY